MVFSWQHKIKLSSECLILNELELRDLTFTSLLKFTKLSRPILSRRLKGLFENNILTLEIKNHNIVYHSTLTQEQHDIVTENLFRIKRIQQLFEELREYKKK